MVCARRTPVSQPFHLENRHSPPKATKLLTPLRPLATNWIDWRDGSWVQIRRNPPWLCDLWIIWVLFNMVKHFWEQWLLPAGSDGGRVQHHEQPCAAPPCPPSLPMQAKSSQPDSRIETFLVVESRLSTFVLFYFFGQSANTFYAFNMGCYHPIVFKWTKKMLVSFWFHFKRGPSKGNAWIVLIRGTFYKSMPHKSYMKVSHKGWSYRRPNLTRWWLLDGEPQWPSWHWDSRTNPSFP